jgi:hypothetical protein
MDILFSNYITQNKEAFLAKVVEISGNLGINPDWLMAVMYKESRLSSTARNSLSGATGLIQFMPATATGLGTTTAALFTMTNVQQLDYVYKYFKPYAGKMENYVNCYLAVFFSVAMRKPDNWIFQTSTLSASTIVKNNPGINTEVINGSAVITVASFAQYAYKGFSAETINRLKKK